MEILVHNKKNQIFIIFLICAAIFTAVPLTQAAEQPWDVQADKDAARREMESDEKGAQMEMDSTVYGEVLKIDNDAKSINIQKNSDEKKGDINTYFINAQTTFTVISSIDELFEGDYVTIDYYSFKGKRFAESVLLEKRGHKQ